MSTQAATVSVKEPGRLNQIVKENLRATQVIYSAAMLEELKIFQVVDRLLQLFQLGLLLVSRPSTGASLYKYWKETSLRLTEAERRNIYSSTLGIAGGTDGVAINREFNDLWLRFVSMVATFSRRSDPVSEVAGSDELALRKSAADLARNLSLHGGGMTYFAARDLQKQIMFSVKLLSDAEITGAYGATDMWQVVDRVATLDLGGSVNINRYRTSAVSGAVIISWLAAKVAKLHKINSHAPLLGTRKAQTTRVAKNDVLRFPLKPTDSYLRAACEQWLSVNGVTDDLVESHAQPRSDSGGTSATGH